MSEHTVETTSIRVKATAKYTSEGWKGILIIDRGDDRARRFGPSRTSLEEAEADALFMLQNFQQAVLGNREDGTLPLPE